MQTREPRALLIGENSQGSSHLVRLLEGHGCECSFATSYEEACSLLGTQLFDLVLSRLRLRDSSTFPLVGLLEGSGVTLFYFQLVEDGCWWLPALRSGQKCFGSHALRPSEFVVSLNEIIAEMRVQSPVPADDQPAWPSTPQTAIATGSQSRSRARPVAA
jgi:CheY-like chemotaxis protein